MDCSTIIVSYNTFELTLVAVETALESGQDLDHEVIVVDNNSPDESGQKLARTFSGDSRVKIIEVDENNGFSAGNNIGVRSAAGEILFFLNPDTVVERKTIPAIVSFIRAHPDAGAVGPRVFNEDGSVQTSVFEFPTARSLLSFYLPWSDLFRGSTSRTDDIPEVTQSVDIVKGCSLAIRRDVFNEVGGWDESYFMYAEENELCLACRNAGYRNYFISEAAILHLGGASGRDQYVKQMVMDRKSTLSYLQRHGSVGLRILNRFAGFLGYFLRDLLFRLKSILGTTENSDLRLRQKASFALWKWFLFDYKP